MERQYDVIVIGAGAAGLIAALEIALTGRSVAVVDAKEKPGGRINTFYTANGYPMELGAEFVHGNLPITKELAKKAGIKMVEVDGSIWQKKDGQLNEQEDFIEDFDTLEKKFQKLEQDISVYDFLNSCLTGHQYDDLRFTLQNYVEGYYAADLKKASTYALREELTKGEEEQYRLNTGYGKLISYLQAECTKHGVQFYFTEPVLQLRWQTGNVTAVTETGSYSAKKTIVTVSVGVLQSEAILFQPSLPHIREAAKGLGFGHVIKTNLRFEKPFWKEKTTTNDKDLHDLNFLFSTEAIPTWWTQHPKNEPMITGWLGGPKVEALQTLPENDIIKKAIHSLASIFTIDVLHLGQLLTAAKVYNWSADPHFNGAYSYAVINGGSLMQKILKPVESTVYFAGEGLHSGNDIGTVEAAFASGREVAQQLIADF